LKTEEILGLVNVIFYAVHIVVFSTLGYKQGKANGVKSVILILIFFACFIFCFNTSRWFYSPDIFHRERNDIKIKIHSRYIGYHHRDCHRTTHLVHLFEKEKKARG